MSKTIFQRNRWFWRCCRSYKGSPRLFKVSENKLKTFSKTGSISSSLSTSSSPHQNDVPKAEKKSFQQLIFDRRRQAHCSIIVEVNSYYSLPYLCKYIETTAKVKKIFHRKINSEQEYFLIECETPSDVNALLGKCRYPESPDSIPVFSRILKYDGTDTNKSDSSQIPCETYERIQENTINKRLRESNNITEQMKELQRCERLSDIDTRLQFFICSQIEDCVSGMFPNSICLPFGSAVNGFGCAQSDLDMNLNLSGKQKASDSLLSFIPKRTLANDRVQDQRMLETVGDVIHTFAPGISQLLRILKARIPILKFHHDIAKIKCDLTVNNMSGVHMAELLYLYGEMNPCVRPLIHTIRRWARKNELTSDGASTKITNFSLILMTVFFLQTRTNPILPPISMIEYSGSSIMESENLSNYFNSSCEDTDDFEALLVEFFLFCATFNFEQAMCVFTGTTSPKPDYNSLYIHNPIEKGLNVSKNVSYPELKKVVDAAKNALWHLEKSNNNNNEKNEQWGILKLFSKQKIAPSGELNRRFHISNLFEKKKTGFSSNNSVIDQHYIPVEANEPAKSKGKSRKMRKSKT